MYFDEISTMHGLIRDMHEPKFSTFELFGGIFAMFCPFFHVFCEINLHGHVVCQNLHHRYQYLPYANGILQKSKKNGLMG